MSCKKVRVCSALANCGRPKIAPGLGQSVRNVARVAKGLEVPLENTSKIVPMALSDYVDFADIAREYGNGAEQVKTLTYGPLRTGNYRA